MHRFVLARVALDPCAGLDPRAAPLVDLRIVDRQAFMRAMLGFVRNVPRRPLARAAAR